jgi:hypothetical protein
LLSLSLSLSCSLSPRTLSPPLSGLFFLRFTH